MTTEIEGKLLTLIDIYGPNKDETEFDKELLQMMTENENMVVMAGDFNLILNPEVDFANNANLNNPEFRDEVLNMMIEANLIDVWRNSNLEKLQFTWRRKASRQKAGLDFFLISELLFTSVEEA